MSCACFAGWLPYLLLLKTWFIYIVVIINHQQALSWIILVINAKKAKLAQNFWKSKNLRVIYPFPTIIFWIHFLPTFGQTYIPNKVWFDQGNWTKNACHPGIFFSFNTNYIRVKTYSKVWSRIVLSFLIINGGTNFWYIFERKLYMSRQLLMMD